MSPWPDYSLSNSIHQLFMKLDKHEIQKLFREIQKESRKKGMVYEEENGSTRLIPLLMRPRLITPLQRTFFLKTCYHMNQAYQKLSWLYLKNPKVKKLFPFQKKEEEWFLQYFPQNREAPRTAITRWDANANFSGQDWRAAFHFLEVNGVGVGGLHYTPTAERIILETVIHSLRPLAPNLQVRPNDDIRSILLWELQAHLKMLGKRRCNIGLILDDRTKGGPLDFFYLAQLFQSQGIEAVVADPRDLKIKKGEIVYKDLPLDILYRDSTLEEFIEMEKEEGKPLKAIRKAFQENVVVSGLSGELDHKSAFEIFSNPEFEHHFNLEERKIFKKHVLWTRLVRETKTTDPDGKRVDLISHAIHHRNEWVLKPNRGYGGMGILMGDETPKITWEKALEKAIRDPGSYVLQKRCATRKKKFPILDEKGRVTEKNLNVVCGFIYSPYGLGILGRASQREIVNVAQQGGMTAILISENEFDIKQTKKLSSRTRH
ncbi:MAG: hypothetical protein HYS08_08965 [Chlamydiae bacterium]|nr:hypothetical protein [Chlamydiota bacterium]MBI3265492.1 hypothetical protein [Chlamydiota bacterium]